jgi:hypothetical protein
VRVGTDRLAGQSRRMRVRPEQRLVYGQGWRLGRAVRELGGRVGALALEIAGGDRRIAAVYEKLALDHLAAVDLRRFGAGDDEYLIRVASVVIRGAHFARKERLRAGAGRMPTSRDLLSRSGRSRTRRWSS